MIVIIVSGLLNLGLNFILVPRYGYIAAAVTTFISYAFLLAGGSTNPADNYPSIKNDLEYAYEHPEDDSYDDIVVKVTGYSAHFTKMDRQFQKEFITRVNYKSL